MKKRYYVAEISFTNKRQESETEKVFIEENAFDRKILDLNDIEDVLNDYAEDEKDLKKYRKHYFSLTQRVSDLRDELEDAKKHQTDYEKIKQVCEIIDNRIQYTANEPIIKHVNAHLEAIKKELQEKGLWYK